MKFFFFIILLSLPTWAQRSLNSQSFQANVRPGLNGIVNDFYQMIAIFPDYPKDLNGIVELVDKLNDEKELLKERCPRQIDNTCADLISSLQKKVSLIDSKTIELLAHQGMANTLYISPLAGMRLINQFQVELLQLKAEIDNSSFMLKGNVKHIRQTQKMIKQLDQLNTLISLAVVEFIPYNYQEDFRHFYFNFVHPIQMQISKNKNYEFLNRNVTSLNFAINLLNMNLTKRSKKTPEGMAPYLALIHNRWNGLLRYYF
jgi:hypothetical protein